MHETINDVMEVLKEKTGSRFVPKIKCKDGFYVSIQASEGHYCFPRTNDGPWLEFELGSPSEVDELISSYIDDPENELAKAVYGYVPSELIDKLIAKHGGIVEAEGKQ